MSLLLIVWILFLPIMANGSTGFVGIKSGGTTQGNGPFTGKGASVTLNTLFYCLTCSKPWSFQPNGWQTLQTLGVNLIRVSAGTEGDVGHFNINRYPNEWAQNFDEFLSLANSHGIRVSFPALGDQYGGLFGILAPQPAQGINGTAISAAMALVDSLAGNNPIGHNFITDQRVMAWSVANEVDLGNNVTYNWCIQLLDYIRSKGGKAYVSSPYDSRIVGTTFLGQMDFRYIEPELRGHVDYLELHIYDMGAVVQALQKKQDVYSTMYNEFNNIIHTYMIDGHGSIPIGNLIIGEFGIWHGEGDDFGLSYNFSEQVRGAYYAAMLQAAADDGISIIDNHYLFDQDYVGGTLVTPAYGIISTDGTYYTNCTSLLQQFYGVSTVTTTTSQSSTSATVSSTTTSVSSSTSKASAQMFAAVDSGQGSVTPDCPNGCGETVGSQVTVTANPASGWQFLSWNVTGVSCSGGASSNPCTFSMPNSPATVSATFTDPQTLITSVDAGSGSVLPNCPIGCQQQVGPSVSVSATTTSGWTFSSWTVTGASCSGGYSSNPCTFSMPSNAVTVSATFTQVTQTLISLGTGWNLISLPYVPADNLLSKVLAAQIAANDFSVVWSYQGGKWSSALLSSGKLSGSLTRMNDGFGYWIYMTKPDTLYVTGSVIPPAALPPTYQLNAGWNLVGFKPQPTVQSESVGQYLSSAGGKYDSNSVWVYDNTSQWIRANSSYALQPGQAMWILMTTPSLLRP